MTVSDDAYNTLSKIKKERETLLDYIKTLEPDEEFAAVLEAVVDDRDDLKKVIDYLQAHGKIEFNGSTIVYVEPDEKLKKYLSRFTELK